LKTGGTETQRGEVQEGSKCILQSDTLGSKSPDSPLIKGCLYPSKGKIIQLSEPVLVKNNENRIYKT
jgi:hypothetical protein